jgi:protein-S-isoprenylcysteine O-methyltransferase Ste14
MSTERIALIVSLGFWLVFELWRQFRDLRNRVAESTDADRRSLWATTGTTLLALGAAIAVAPQMQGVTVLPWRESTVEFVVGMVLLWGGIVLRLWAIRTLGRFFNSRVVIREDHEVIRTGPYRWIRHPSYTAALVTGIGAGILLGNWISLAIMTLLPLAGYLYRIRVEEAALAGSVGDPYQSYAQTTRRLVPFIW